MRQNMLILSFFLLTSCFHEPDISEDIYIENKESFLSAYKKINDPRSKINLLHISDTHIWSEDSEMNLAHAILLGQDPNMFLSGVICTGDLTIGSGSKVSRNDVISQLRLNAHLFSKSKVPPMILLGNHDANDVDRDVGKAITKREQWDNLFEAISKRWDKIVWGDKESGCHYHYYDIIRGDEVLRIISLDQLDTQSYVDEQGKLIYRSMEDAVYSQKQINWLCSEALNTSANTSIIVCNHFPFMRKGDKANSLLINGQFTQGWQMIPDIVRAWQNGDIINKEYMDIREKQHIAVNCDFSTISSSKEFICYLVGHAHFKTHGVVEGYNQLLLMENTLGQGRGLFSDVERIKKTASSNAFSALSIDLKEKKIYRTSFGAYSKSLSGIDDRVEIIDYKINL